MLVFKKIGSISTMGLLSYDAVSTGIILLKNWQCPQKAQPVAYFSFIFFFFSFFLAAA